ncbi:hypothetical protein, partial [Streptomyces boluensis]
AKTVLAAALGVVVSALLAAFVTLYFDMWASSGPSVPGAKGMHAESEVWWDLTRDTRAVRVPGLLGTADVRQQRGDAELVLDRLVEGGGTHAGMMRIRLTLMNFSKAPLSVTEVRARVVDEQPVREGTLLACGGSQGGVGIARVRIDLGSANKSAQEYDGDDLVGQYPTNELQLAKQDEPAIFDIKVEDGPATYSYVIDVSYTQGTKKGRIVVDQAGKPFVLSPATGSLRAEYQCNAALNGWSKRR